MTRNNFVKIILALLLLQYVCCEDVKSDEKSVSKRGILHLNIHGHHLTPHSHIHPHVHLASPHNHVHVAAATPHFHLASPHVHHHVPFVPKIPVFHKPHVHLLQPPVTPYHIHHGGATVTSYNVNYPRIPLVPKAIVPAVIPSYHHHAFIPHHHQHAFIPHHYNHGILPHSHVVPHTHSILPHHHHAAAYPHYHVNKPIIPVAVPGIRAPKFPTYLPPKPVFVHSKPQFVPIPLPSESSAIPFNPTGSENVPSCTTSHINNQNKGSWQQPMTTRINFSPIKPNLNNFQPPTYNYHAHHKTPNDDDNLFSKITNNFQVSGQGTSGQYLAYPQQLIQEPQSNFLRYSKFK
jgi:hypothetical protein